MRATTATRYDAIIATFVGVLALLVSGYTAYVQRQQVRAQVWPMLEGSYTNMDDVVTVVIANKGTGPASVKHVRVTLDGQPVPDWEELFKRLGQPKDVEYGGYSNIGRRTLSPGDSMNVLMPGKATPGSAAER